MEIAGLIILGILFCIYIADPKGWNATAKRLTTIVRANIEAAKPVKQLESSSKKALEQKSKDNWTADFTGKPIDNGKKHEIVRTWFAKVNSEVRPYWKCKCGHSDWHVNIEMSKLRSSDHVREQNKAEEMLARNGGTHAW